MRNLKKQELQLRQNVMHIMSGKTKKIEKNVHKKKKKIERKVLEAKLAFLNL